MVTMDMGIGRIVAEGGGVNGVASLQEALDESGAQGA